jgi:DNA-binding winged helix-turn-helix (wHTH) protein
VTDRGLDAAQKEKAAKLTAMMLRWAEGEAALDLETILRLPIGRVQVAAETMGWLLEVCAQIGRELGWPPGAVQAARLWAERIAWGLPERLLSLGRELAGIMGRERMLELGSLGLTTRDGWDSLPEERRRRLVPEAPAATDSSATPSGASTQVPRRLPHPWRPADQGHTHPAESDFLLRWDERRPDRVEFHGRIVYLTPTEYRLLQTLAAEPGRCFSYEELYDVLWGDDLVEPGQIHWHRHQLVQKLKRALPDGGESPLRTLPRRGYLLDLPAARVQPPPAYAPG